MIVSSYFGPILARTQRNLLVREAVKDLRPRVNEFDSIIYRGHSGACMAPVLAWIFNKHLLIVRKQETQHSGYDVEGKKEVSKVLFVDDFISQGNTYKAVVEALKVFSPEAQLVGVYTYLSEASDFLKKKVEPTPVWGRTTPGPGYYATE